ncbi:hypothetical protein QJ857_gp0009 [Tupanvirus soda lake]|uniref:NHL repeat-containing protein n=2 Tax=Tupanvirus TaxID=2094720 RepID=A0A6N1NSI1_9VIRU|nr:hypothetical protein QJ857_gp0009 [Tupanvirus soda lake]QKU34658.1 hypothetical protein [Tupanvirus soda lake]
MSYMQYNDFRHIMRSGRSPFPYPYYNSYNNQVPNLSNDERCRNNFVDPYAYYFNYEYIPVDNLSYNVPSPQNAIYDYYCYDKIPFQDPSCALGFTVQKLVSNIPTLAVNIDPNLLDPWGIIIVNDIVWVANSGSGFITSYDLLGRPLLPIINVFGPIGNIAQPTGIACNSCTSAFTIVNGSLRAASNIIIVTRDGTINGYNALIDPINSILLIDNSANNSVYTGVAVVNIVNNLTRRNNRINTVVIENTNNQAIVDNIPNVISRNIIFVTDFYNQSIDVFDDSLNRLTNYPFIDEDSGEPIPEDYGPYNIVNICDLLYVLYAKQDPADNQYVLPGIGNGYISIFTLDGIFVRRFVSRGPLNAPWGLVLAPSRFGYPSGSIMVSNFGDGIINIFDTDGKHIGCLSDKSNNNICLNGLRGLALNPNYERILYWSGSDNLLRDAFVGSINTRLNI